MIPKIIHQVWVGPNPLPNPFIDLRNKMLSIHKDWEYCLWTDDNVHEICTKKDYDHYSYAGQSNKIRLYALLNKGGIYLDFDFDVLQSFDKLLEYNAFVAKQPDGVFCNAFIGSSKGNVWIKDMLDNYGDHNKKDASWGCHIIKDYINSDVTVVPTDYFYPYNFDESPKPSTENTIAVHLWEGSWLKK